MTDAFSSYTPGLTSPGTRAFAITPSDTEDLPHVTRAIYIGGSGNIVAVTQGGDEVTFASVFAGSILPVRIKRVKNTGTTATLLIGIY
jgi:hypothetical protein